MVVVAISGSAAVDIVSQKSTVQAGINYCRVIRAKSKQIIRYMDTAMRSAYIEPGLRKLSN